MKFYDLHLHPKNQEDAISMIKTAERLGWHGVCLVEHFSGRDDFRRFHESVSGLKKDAGIEVFTGAEIKGKNRQDIQKNARKSLEFADIIFAHGSCDVNREIAEAGEIDVICHPERDVQRDFMDQKNSGIDHIISKLLFESNAAVEINFSDIINSYGFVRARIMGRMSQNIGLAREYNFLSVLASGACSVFGMRSPMDFIAVCKSLGMTDAEAKNSVSKNPERIIQKSVDRKNPNAIMSGLDVVAWGSNKPAEKKISGLY